MKTLTPACAARTFTPRLAALTALMAIASITLLVCADARAQSVYKCLIEGSPVFQSSPCAIDTRVASAALRSKSAEAPMVSTPPKKKTLAELLHDRDGADAGRPHVREPQSDGANVLRSRMGAV